MTTLRAMLCRMTWMFIGPMLLVAATIAVAVKRNGWVSFADVAFFLVLGAMLAGRWFEFRLGDPQTATGERATRQDLRRYALGMVAVGLGIWGAATVVATLRLGT
jgi:hypothetical protein